MKDITEYTKELNRRIDEKNEVLRERPRFRQWMKYAVAAAVLCVIAAGVFVVMNAAGVWNSDNASPNLNNKDSVGETEMSGLVPSDENESSADSSESSGPVASDDEYDGVIRLAEGFDPNLITGKNGDTMYIIKDGKMYKVEVISKDGGGPMVFDNPSVPGAGENDYVTINGEQIEINGIISDKAKDGLEKAASEGFQGSNSGDFMKNDMPAVTYMINGESKTFYYQKSVLVRKDADMDLDGRESYYILDHYINADGSTVLRNDGSEELMKYGTNNFSAVQGEQISKEKAIEKAKYVLLNTDLPISVLASAEGEFSNSASRYRVNYTFAEGKIEVCLDKTGGLQYLTVKKDASLRLSSERIAAAREKINSKLEKLKNDKPTERYVLQSESFEQWGSNIYAFFEVVCYPFQYSDACSVYQYYCVA